MTKKCCCGGSFPECSRCKQEDGSRYRSLNDFSWTVTPSGVANASSESIYDMCVRYREIFYPGGPYPPLPICVDEPFLCDTAPCTDYNKAYSISAWTVGGAGTYREPPWPNCSAEYASALFEYVEECFWAGTLFADRSGVADSCTQLNTRISWMRKANARVTIGAYVEMIGPSGEFDRPRIAAAGHLDLAPLDGRIECDGFDEEIPLSTVYASNNEGQCPPDDATRCSLPTSLRLQGVL
jgi:hypothetical protein